MATDNSLEAFDFGVPDVADTQQAFSNQFQNQLSKDSNVAELGRTYAAHGLDNVANGNVAMQRTKKLQDAMQNIMQQVQTTAPEGEDPMDHQLRLANAMAVGMTALDPNIAAKASAQAVKLQQAKEQQAHLVSEDQYRGALTTAEQQKITLTGLDAKTAIVDSADPEKGVFKTIDKFGPDGKTPNPNYAQEYAAALADAAKAGYKNPLGVEPKQAFDTKNQVAATRAAAAVQVATIRAATAAAKAQPETPEQKQYMKDVVAQSSSIEALSQLADYAAKNPDALKTSGAASSFIDKAMSNLQSMFPGDPQETASARQMVSSPKDAAGKPNPLYISNASEQGMVLKVAFALARSSVGGRITEKEIAMAKSMLMGPNGNPDPKVLLSNIGNMIQSQRSTLDSRSRLQPSLTRDPNSDTAVSIDRFGKDLDAKLGNINDSLSKMGAPKIGAEQAAGGKAMPTGAKLSTYAAAHFKGDEAKAKEYLASQGYK